MKQLKILTFHRALNYGAALQCHALLSYLAEKNKVEILDYWPIYHQRKASLWVDILNINKKLSSQSIKQVFKFIILISVRFKKIKRFQMFQREFLKLSGRGNDKITNTEQFSTLIIGSDQIWRKYYDQGIDYIYFGENLSDDICLTTYAASMGSLNSNIINDARVQLLLNRFSKISVREHDLQSALNEISATPVKCVLDPVFLRSKQYWQKLANNSSYSRTDRYLLNYNLTLDTRNNVVVEKLTQLRNLKCLQITGDVSVRGLKSGNIIQTAGPLEFLSLVRDCEYMITSSFHGVAFSILFEKQFVCVGLDAHSNRVTSLLNSLGISDRIVNDPSDVANLKEINYASVHLKLSELIDFSKQYLGTIPNVR